MRFKLKKKCRQTQERLYCSSNSLSRYQENICYTLFLSFDLFRCFFVKNNVFAFFFNVSDNEFD